MGYGPLVQDGRGFRLGVLLMFDDTGGYSDRNGLQPCVNQADENGADCELLFCIFLGGQPRDGQMAKWP